MVVLPDNNDEENDSYAFVSLVALAVAKACQLFNQRTALLSLDGEDKKCQNMTKKNKYCVDVVFCNSSDRNGIVNDLVDFALIEIFVAKIPYMWAIFDYISIA